MSEIFLSVLNLSITASYIILLVVLIRTLLKKAPKIISYALWGIVAFRLVVPFSFEGIFNPLPQNVAINNNDIAFQHSTQSYSRINLVEVFARESLLTPTAESSVDPLQVYLKWGTYIWIIGIIVLLIYSLVSVLLLKRQLKNAELLEKNIYEARNLKTPFVLGLIRPKIYLPIGLGTEERNYILLHEQTHIRKKDHIIKTLAFIILAIHWFNPLVWVAFRLMSIDMEFSCDERVLKEKGADIKKTYAKLLLSFATGRHILNNSPLSFGEGNVKGRVKNVLNYKKTKFGVVFLALIIATVGLFALSINPRIHVSLGLEKPVGVDVQDKARGNEQELNLEELKLILGRTVEEFVSEHGNPIREEYNYSEYLEGNIMTLFYDFGEAMFIPYQEKTFLTYLTLKTSDIIGPYGIRVGDEIQSIFTHLPNNCYDENYIRTAHLGGMIGPNLRAIYLSENGEDLGLITYDDSGQIISVEYIKGYETGGGIKLRFDVEQDKIVGILVFVGYM